MNAAELEPEAREREACAASARSDDDDLRVYRLLCAIRIVSPENKVLFLLEGRGVVIVVCRPDGYSVRGFLVPPDRTVFAAGVAGTADPVEKAHVLVVVISAAGPAGMEPHAAGRTGRTGRVAFA